MNKKGIKAQITGFTLDKKIMETSFKTHNKCEYERGLGAKNAIIPNEEIWDQLSEVCGVGVAPHHVKALKILTDISIEKDSCPTTVEDWQEIIVLQKEYAEEKEDFRMYKGHYVMRYWPQQ